MANATLAYTTTAPAASDELRRQELGAFLRSRRERIAPEQVGLPVGARRRTPGLRREEVAQLAGVGVTWYTWLEQGRDIRVSEDVLEAVARTLFFDPQERLHLFTLAGAAEPIEQECRSLSPAIHVLVEQLDPLPACVQNGRFDLLAYNRAYGELITDLSLLPMEDRNTLWLCFTHPDWRKSLVDWEDGAARMVGQLRVGMAEHMAEPAWKHLLKRLCDASPEFVAMWERQEVHAAENRLKVFLHHRVGLLNLDYTNLWLGPRSGSRLITYTPADDQTRTRLEKLAAKRVHDPRPAATLPRPWRSGGD
jgi:transcriptional regulator with XRE-family HTH domain